MSRAEEPPPPPAPSPASFYEQPNDSPLVLAAVAELRRRAEHEPEQRQERRQPLSDAFLVRFLRARDFHQDLAWKVMRGGHSRRTRAGWKVPGVSCLGGPKQGWSRVDGEALAQGGLLGSDQRRLLYADSSPRPPQRLLVAMGRTSGTRLFLPRRFTRAIRYRIHQKALGR